MVIDTALDEENGMYPEGQEKELDVYERIVEPRSIVVLKAVKDKSYRPKRRRAVRGNKGKADTEAKIKSDAEASLIKNTEEIVKTDKSKD